MDHQHEETPLKVRSYRSVIAAAFQLYNHSILQMLKSVWPWILLTAVLSTATGLLTIIERYLFIPLPILTVLSEMFLWVMATRWLTKKSLKDIMRKTSRHWLLMLWVVIATLLVLLPLVELVGLPLTILALAQWEATNSFLIGDTEGIPHNMPYFLAAVWCVITVLQLIIRLFVVYIGYYAWGSAEVKKRDREQQRLNLFQ